MTSPPDAGWYPDPGGSGGQRWWNGQSWSDSVTAAPSPPVASPPVAPLPPYQQRSQSGFMARSGNRNALITFAVVAVYIVVAAESRIVFFGILPLAYAVRSRNSREALWPLAMGAALVSIAIAAFVIFGR